ncbi:hypothetical protein HYR54_05320 [Candidatus Acetothermia bacterium]|nr:hypothetical protein [Candidatus Acetothermia bacterium]
MNKLRISGIVLVLALAISAGAVLAKALPIEVVPVSQAPSVSYSLQIEEQADGTLKLTFYLDLNGNEQLDEGEPIAQVLTVSAH